jgi:hypothetical protein
MRALLVSLVGSAILLGCRDTPFSPEVLTLVATIAPSPLHGGDTATVVVSLTNDTPLSVHVSGTPCPFGFEIVDQSGAVVGGISSLYCVQRILISRAIRPGETVSQAFPWVANDSGGSPLVPGDYGVRGDCSWVSGGKSQPQPFVVTP